MKRILIPTDFSDCAAAAESAGLQIAEKAGAELHFLHLIPTPVDWIDIPLEKEKLYPEVRAEIARAKNALSALVARAEAKGIQAEPFLVFNKSREEIVEHVKVYACDFVVMGSHGAKGFREIIGSNAQQVVRASPVPVLVVKKVTDNFEVKNIVFASDFEEDVHAPFREILEFARLMHAQLHLLYVNMPYHFKETDEAETAMADFMSRYNDIGCTMNIYNAQNEERGIEKFTRKIKADAVAITTHGRSGFMKIISSGVTESLVNHSGVPVLSVNIKVGKAVNKPGKRHEESSVPI